MPTVSTIIEDTSPVLVYNGSWQPGSSADSFLSSYTQASFMATQTQGASMTFSFFGSSVSIYGAKRANHGTYHVRIDDQTFPQASGSAPTNTFNQTLFSTQVDLGFHNVTITNDSDSFLDIDYVLYDTSVGHPSESLIVNTYEDAHPSFAYQPLSAWSPPPLVGTFFGNSGHATQDTSATATFTFQTPEHPLGNAVGLFGPVGPNNTQAYSVMVDNGAQTLLSAQNTNYRPQQMLFYAGNLSSGIHTVKIKSKSDAGLLAIDYANVYTTKSLGGSFGSAIAIQASPSGPSSGLIAGLSITTTLAVFSIFAFIWLFFRERRRQPQIVDLTEEKLERPDSAIILPFSVSRDERDFTGGKYSNAQRPFPQATFEQSSMAYFNPPPGSIYPPSTPAESRTSRQIRPGPPPSSYSSSSSTESDGNYYDSSAGSSKRRLEYAYDAQDRQDLPAPPRGIANPFQIVNPESGPSSAGPSATPEHQPPPEYTQDPGASRI